MDWTHKFNRQVNGSLKLSNGQHVVWGEMSRFNPTFLPGVAMLNPDGSLDHHFKMDSMYKMEVYTFYSHDDVVYIGGYFENKKTNVVSFLKKVDLRGQEITSFNPKVAIYGRSIPPKVKTITVDSEGNIYIAINFDWSDGSVYAHVLKYDPNGVRDVSFGEERPKEFNGTIWSLLVQENGKVVVGGDFNKFDLYYAPGLGRLTKEGKWDFQFGPGPGLGFKTLIGNYSVRALHTYKDHRFLVGGHFTGYGGDALGGGITRLFQDGTRDPSFWTGSKGNCAEVNDFEISPAQVIYLVGSSQDCAMAKLSINGVIDSEFVVPESPPFDAELKSISIDSENNLHIAGDNGMAILTSSGDQKKNALPLLKTGFDGPIQSMLRLPNGKYLVAGDFQSFGGTPIDIPIVCVKSNGSINDEFSHNLNEVLKGFESVDRVELIGKNSLRITGKFYSYVGDRLIYDSIDINLAGQLILAE